VFRRLLVDTHVPDWHPDLLARFDPAEYVATAARAGFQSLMQYANSTVGLCLWRTKVGQMHANLRGRDIFGEVITECRRQGLQPRAYFCAVWDNWACERHPHWRIMEVDGYDRVLESRYGLVCPNSPYRDYVKACMQEIVGNYDLEGIFIDMTMWPDVCYCPHCTARYWQEHKAEPPRIVDWDDPEWRRFQKARQQWLLEFAEEITGTIRKVRSIPVYHQNSSLFLNWKVGVPLQLAQASDFAGGDFYGGPAQYSLICKAYHGLSQTRPFEFMTSMARSLWSRVTLKTMDEIQVDSFVPTLHSAALMLIDGINPDGTLNQPTYDFIAKVNAQHAPYEPFLGGDLLADVAIYYDKESMYNPAEKGVHVSRLEPVVTSGDLIAGVGDCSHRDALMGVARFLREDHIPFGVVTNANLQQLSNYRAVVLPNVLEMTAEQAGHFREFVEDGGVLYVSGASSLDRFNARGPRFLLEEVLGVRYKGILGTKVTFLSPKDEQVRKTVWPQRHLSFDGPMILAEALPGSEVLATVTLPFVAPEVGHVIGSRFADAHSSHPALTAGADPAVVVHAFGRGKAVWLAAPIESGAGPVNAKLVLSLLRRVLPGPYRFEVETHPAVEMTLFHQAEKRRLLGGLLNMAQQLPPIAVGATVRVQVPASRQVTGVLRLPERKAMQFEKIGPYVQFRLEPFESLVMVLVEYQ
jgi:hypothetical protein